MNFDPGEHGWAEEYENTDEMAEDNYEEGFKDGQNEAEEEAAAESIAEEDDHSGLDHPFGIAAAAGIGYEMAQREIDERQIAENILKNRTRKVNEFLKVSLKTRHVKRGGQVSPARRWMSQVCTGQKTTRDPVDYTEEEKREILNFESETD